MERESFVFYRSFYEAIQDLDAEQTRELVVAVCERALNGNEIEIDDKIVKMAMNLIRPQLDANTKRYIDGRKGGQFGHLGGAPEGNSNATKNWDKVSKQPHRGSENNPTGVVKTTPNVNVNVNVNDNVNENVNDNEKGLQGETLDANASRGNIEKVEIGKKNDSMKLSDKLKALGLEDEVVELAITYNGCKKGKKLDKFKDQQLEIRVNKLKRCGYNTNEGMKEVLENSIAGGYEGIFELKTKPIPKPKIEEGKVVKVGGANIFF